jgi:hypothetical protein
MLCEAARQQQWTPDMQRLERLTMPGDMTQQDYAEAWAWIHFLLDSTPQRAELLRNHLARIRITGTAPPFSQVLAGAEPQAPLLLIQHLHTLPKQ